MGGTTNSQALRYPYDTDTISDTGIKNLADDCATQLAVQDARRTSALKRPAVEIGRNASQSFSDGVDTLVQMDFENQDTDNYVNLGVSNTRITVPTAGTGIWYVAVSCVNPGFTSSVTKGQLSVTVTGAVQLRRTWFSGTGAVKNSLRLAGLVSVPNNNDYIEMMMLHTGGGALNASNFFMKAMRLTS